MAKNRLTDWDTTAGNNTDVGGINIAEGWAPENVNNAARETMSQLAEFHGDITGKLTSGGAAGAYTLTTNDGVSAYAAGQLYAFVANHANPAAATLNVNLIGTKSILKNHDVALAGGEIEANQLVVVAYEATNDAFLMLSQVAKTLLESLTLASGATCTAILDEDDMATDSDTALATQQSIKAYIDNNLAVPKIVIRFTGAATPVVTTVFTSGASDPTVVRNAIGIFTITFNETFSAVPVCLVTGRDTSSSQVAGGVELNSITTTQCVIRSTDENGANVDYDEYNMCLWGAV